MSKAPLRARVLLLVEDNPADFDIAQDLLAQVPGDAFHIVHAPGLDSALDTLATTAVQVVVLDLNLPDSRGVETVRAVRARAGHVPIVVLTGSDDEQLGLACIDAGAQDFLAKSEATARNLHRAIGHAITRHRETQLREMQQTLLWYRSMSSGSQQTSVTAALAKSGALAIADPRAFQQLVRDYGAFLEPYLLRKSAELQAARDDAERLITRLGEHGGGPRDLIDVHVAAIDQALERFTDPYSRTVVVEARLLALQMMGLLVDFYRVGRRRRSEKEIS